MSSYLWVGYFSFLPYLQKFSIQMFLQFLLRTAKQKMNAALTSCHLLLISRFHCQNPTRMQNKCGQNTFQHICFCVIGCQETASALHKHCQEAFLANAGPPVDSPPAPTSTCKAVSRRCVLERSYRRLAFITSDIMRLAACLLLPRVAMETGN